MEPVTLIKSFKNPKMFLWQYLGMLTVIYWRLEWENGIKHEFVVLCVILFPLISVRLVQTGVLGKRHEHTHISLEQSKDNSKNIFPFCSFSSCAISFTCRLNLSCLVWIDCRALDIVFLSNQHISDPVPLLSPESGILELIYLNILFTIKKQTAITAKIINIFTKK